jgi:hypothetical protein
MFIQIEEGPYLNFIRDNKGFEISFLKDSHLDTIEITNIGGIQEGFAIDAH